MHRLSCGIIAIYTCGVAASAIGPFYVSLAGNDSWTGLLPTPSAGGNDGPFLTPAAAAKAVSAAPRPFTEDTYVNLRGGDYYLSDPLILGPGAGGDGPTARVVWQQYAGDAPAVLSGGATVSGWQLSRAGIWRAALPTAAAPRVRSLFVNGERRWPARVPQVAGPARSDTYSDAATLHFVSSLDGCGAGECWPSQPCNESDAWGFVYNATDARGPNPTWKDITGIDVLVFGAWTAAWAPVASLHASNASLITAIPLDSAMPGHWGGEGCPSGARFVLHNVAEALLPGSGAFYVSDAELTVYYAPLAGEDPSSPAAFTAVVPVLPTVLSVAGDDCGGPVEWLELRGFNVSHAYVPTGATRNAYPASGALALASARNVLVAGVTVSGSEASGIYLGTFLINATVANSTVRDAGGDGIGTIPWATYGNANITITDSVIDGIGHLYLNQPTGIRAAGGLTGTYTISHNLVRDTPYAGISAGWHDGVPLPVSGLVYLIEGNLIEDCGQSILSDFGGVYVSSSGTQCEDTDSCYIPTLVTGNLVRRVQGYNYGGNGAYTDENVAGVAFVGNAFTNISGAAVYLHCGLNQTVSNNLLYAAHNTAGASFGTGLLAACNTGGVPPGRTNISAVVDTNVWLVDAAGAPGGAGTLFDAGDAVPEAGTFAMRFERNVYWLFNATAGNVAGLRWPPDNNATFAAWQAAGEDADGAVADPLVTDPRGGDFSLRPGSPAVARGFAQLDLAGVGPRW